MSKPKHPLTNVYIDGFNFYYGCYQDPEAPENRWFKWLDFQAFCEHALPRERIHRIRYFTARVAATARDPLKPQRQQAYLRALDTIENLSIHEGHFLTTQKQGMVVTPPQWSHHLATVEVREEKGSDVNLATYLLIDAFDRDFELAVVISNDSDLAGPIGLVRERFGLQVGVLNPNRRVSNALRRASTFDRPIPREALATCQFPETMSDARGVFHRPAAWKRPLSG